MNFIIFLKEKKYFSEASEDDKNNDKALEALEDISHYEDETAAVEPKIETTRVAEPESTLTQKEDNGEFLRFFN